jgi:predicted negative regulator of RcsB-dependent stress response
MSEQEQKKTIIQEIEEEVDETIHPFLEKILNNLKPIGLTIAAIVLGAGLYSGYDFYQQSQQEKAANELGNLLAIKDNKARAEKLEVFLTGAPDNLKIGVQLELARTYMDSKDYDKAAQVFARLAGVEDDSLKPVAILGQVKALEFSKQYAQALEILEKNKQDFPGEYNEQVTQRVAFLAEKVEDWTKALAAYEELKAGAEGGETKFFDYKIQVLKKKVSS